jgi:hypothetical protein
MDTPPPVNPDSHKIADWAKYHYATGSQKLANIQYRLAELAGTGQLDPKESLRLQFDLAAAWEDLYAGTVCAVRDENTPDETWDEADNTYSRAHAVKTTNRVEPLESSDWAWEHNRFLCGDGAVNEFPRGAVFHIAQPGSSEPPTPQADGPRPPWERVI